MSQGLATTPPKFLLLEATAAAPLGPPAADGNPLCTALRGPRVRSIAVVGNGPLDEDARRDIGTADVVVRHALSASNLQVAPSVGVRTRLPLLKTL